MNTKHFFQENVIPRSSSKPEGSNKEVQKTKRRNSLDDADFAFRTHSNQISRKSNEDRPTNTMRPQRRAPSSGGLKSSRENKQGKTCTEPLVVETPLSRAPRGKSEKTNKSSKEVHRKSRHKTDENKNAVKKHGASDKMRKSDTSHSKPRSKRRERRKEDNDSSTRRNEIAPKSNGKSKDAEVETPSSRAQKTTKNHHSKSGTAKSSREKSSSNFIAKHGDKEVKKKNHKKKDLPKQQNRVTGSKKLKSTHNHRKSNAERGRNSTSKRARGTEIRKNKCSKECETKDSDEKDRRKRKRKVSD